MNNYDDLLREKENDEQFNESSLEKHWAAMENKMDTHTQQPKYRRLFIGVIGIAAALLIAFCGYLFFTEKKGQSIDTIASTLFKSMVLPPLKGLDVPYENFSFDAAKGDTLFTLNGSIIIFPRNAVLNAKGETVTGNIEVRTREFNDPFDYSIAGIPMNYDSAGSQYKFISSAMIDITAYKNGEKLQVNPAAKPQLNLVSTNKERKTNLYKLDTVNGKWINRGIDEVNLVRLKNVATDGLTNDRIYAGATMDSSIEVNGDADFFAADSAKPIPAPPQKASNLNPLINVMIDPGSFKELLVYDGLKFEVIDTKAGKVEEDSKMDWDNIELIRGDANGTYKVIFSAKNRKAIYNVKPVLEGKEFVAAEKLYQEKLKEFTKLQTERKKDEADNQKLLMQQDVATKQLEEDNKKIAELNKKTVELNKLIAIRNKFIEAENIKIDALNKENRRRRDSLIMRRDSLIKVNNEIAEKQQKEFEKQQAIWEQNNRTAALEQNLIRSFEIDGFGYWNCDQPTLPGNIQYVSSFKNMKNEVVSYTTLCMATIGINRIQNYYSTGSIGLIPNARYFGWAFNANRFYYFTKEDFINATKTNNPNTISISMTLYEGDAKNYKELKAYIFNVNNNRDVAKK